MDTAAATTAVYLRISDDRTGEEAGVTRQRTDCIDYCERRDWTVAEIFEDNDQSAFRGNGRKNYRRMLEAIEAGLVTRIVAWHVDRLYRQPRELENLIDLAEKVTISTLYGDLDLSTSDGRAMARVLVAMAAKESDDKSRRVTRQQAERAQQGLPHTGRRAFGFTADGLELEPDEADLVKQAAADVLAGATLTSVCREWHAAGVTGTRGRPVDASSLKDILLNPRHAALVKYQGEVIGETDKWPAVIDRATHERLVRMFNSGDRKHGPRRRRLLTGVCRCGRCGAALRHNGDKTKPALHCKRRPGSDACGRLSASYEPLEALIVAAVLDVFDGPGLAEKLGEKQDDGGDATAELVDIEARMTAAAEEFADGHCSRADWLTIRGRLEKRRQRAQATLARVSGSAAIGAYVGKEGALREAWPALKLDQRRAVLAAVVDRVVVAPATKRTGRRFDPDRVQITWKV